MRRSIRTLLLGILAVLVLLVAIGMYFGNQRKYPYWVTIVRVDKAFGRCVVTIQQDGPKMETELRLLPRRCIDDIKPGVRAQVVSNEAWSLSIPSLLP